MVVSEEKVSLSVLPNVEMSKVCTKIGNQEIWKEPDYCNCKHECGIIKRRKSSKIKGEKMFPAAKKMGGGLPEYMG